MRIGRNRGEAERGAPRALLNHPLAYFSSPLSEWLGALSSGPDTRMSVHFAVDLSVQCMQTSRVGGWVAEDVLRKTAVCANEAEL